MEKQQELSGMITDYKIVNQFFALMQIHSQEHQKPIRIVGKPPSNLEKGMKITAHGHWEKHQTYGPQFQAKFISGSLEKEKITGTIEDISHYANRTRFGIIQVNLDGNTIITAKGEMPFPFVGNDVSIEGEWQVDNKYGKQFLIHKIESIPRTRYAILKTLTYYGIPQEDAETLYYHYGPNTISTLRYQPQTILELVERIQIDPSKLRELFTMWQYHEKREEIANELVLYHLQNYTDTILAAFGPDTIRIIETKPYRLIEVEGIGFKTADRVARQVGIQENDEQRLVAALWHCLSEFANNGHTCVPSEVLIRKTQSLVNQSSQYIEKVLKTAILAGTVSADKSDSTLFIYLPNLLSLEENIAKYLHQCQSTPSKITTGCKNRNWSQYLQILSQQNEVSLTNEQQAAVINALEHKVSILTGGPGTGKTTTLRMVINALLEEDCHVTLASPTGKAAKRLSESTKQNASTLHRILAWNEESQNFTHNRDNPLETDAIVIDEASMIDLPLFHSLLEALPLETHVIIVGDIYQLPSVGTGNILRDLIESNTIPVTTLTQIFRQASTSKIIVNAYHINNGEELEIDNQNTDFYFFRLKDENGIPDMIANIIVERLERVYGEFDPYTDIQVLSPMKRGTSGINAINQVLQNALNPAQAKQAVLKRGQQREFRIGDKVIQIKNDYSKEVFNGDQGRITSINPEKEILTVQIDNNIIEYNFNEVYEQLLHAYCISTHRSQGSEYPVVIMPVSSEHGIMLQRNLLYTGVTRAKKMLILVGNPDAVNQAIATTSNTERWTGLTQRLINFR